MSSTTPHRATPEQWADIEQWGGTLTACLLELRSRLEALEAGATCPHVVTSDEGTSYCGLAEQMAAASSPDHVRDATEMAPAGSLVERVADAIESEAGSIFATVEARAAIREVAAWMREHHADGDLVAATVLEQEAERA